MRSWQIIPFILLPFVILLHSSARSEDLSENPDMSKEEELSALRQKLQKNLDEIKVLQTAIENHIESDEHGTHIGPSIDLPAVCQGRLTLLAATPVTTTDQTAITTLRFTPYLGNTISLYDTTALQWTLFNFSETTLTLSGLTTNDNYDVFAYNNGGTLALELSAAWANDTTRTDALALQGGVYVKNVDNSRKYLGTFRATSATTTEDSALKRFVWNYYNRQVRYLFASEAANSWTYSSTTWRAANANTADRVQFVIGVNDVLTFARVENAAGASAGTGVPAANGIGLDSTTTNSATIYGSNVPQIGTYSYFTIQSDYAGYPGIGFHYFQWLETASASTITFISTNGNAFQGAGIFGEVSG